MFRHKVTGTAYSAHKATKITSEPRIHVEGGCYSGLCDGATAVSYAMCAEMWPLIGETHPLSGPEDTKFLRLYRSPAINYTCDLVSNKEQRDVHVALGSQQKAC